MPCHKHNTTACFCKFCDAELIEAGRRAQLEEALVREGYFDFRWFGDVCVGLHDYYTTRGIVVGLNEASYERRYCYQDREEASAALARWNGENHPDGNWIKLKGRWNGEPVDMFNPNWSQL